MQYLEEKKLVQINIIFYLFDNKNKYMTDIYPPVGHKPYFMACSRFHGLYFYGRYRSYTTLFTIITLRRPISTLYDPNVSSHCL